MTKTKYSEVYELLKSEILEGKYGKSLAVPSEMQLYEYFEPIARELVAIAQRTNSAFLFSNIDADDPAQRRRNVRELAADFIRRHVAGVVYHPTEFLSADDATNADVVEVFRRRGIPVVLLDSDIVIPPARLFLPEQLVIRASTLRKTKGKECQ